LVVEIGLPEAGEKLEIVLPTAFVEAFADGVGNIRFFAACGRAIDVGFDGVFCLRKILLVR